MDDPTIYLAQFLFGDRAIVERSSQLCNVAFTSHYLSLRGTPIKKVP